MSVILQLLFAVFFVVSLGVSIVGIITIVRTSELTYKPLWLIGSLFGFCGLTINWTQPDDLFLSFGIAFPVVSITWLGGSGSVIAKAMFPFIALAAIWKVKDNAQLRRFQETRQTRASDEDLH